MNEGKRSNQAYVVGIIECLIKECVSYSVKAGEIRSFGSRTSVWELCPRISFSGNFCHVSLARPFWDLSCPSGPRSPTSKSLLVEPVCYSSLGYSVSFYILGLPSSLHSVEVCSSAIQEYSGRNRSGYSLRGFFVVVVLFVLFLFVFGRNRRYVSQCSVE